MQHLLGGLSFPRERRCLCCNALFMAHQIRDKHCSPACLHAWNEGTLALRQNFPQNAETLPALSSQ